MSERPDGFFSGGRIGSLAIRAAGPSAGPPAAVVAQGVVGLILVAAGAVLIGSDATDVESVAVPALGLIVYLFVAYWLDVEPDMENIGFFHGLVNHPFRMSDNINRTMAFVKVALMPGRFVARSLVGVVWLARGRRVIELPPWDG
jgi:hypothetical protein